MPAATSQWIADDDPPTNGKQIDTTTVTDMAEDFVIAQAARCALTWQPRRNVVPKDLLL